MDAVAVVNDVDVSRENPSAFVMIVLSWSL